jgi:hypothetical protein
MLTEQGARQLRKALIRCGMNKPKVPRLRRIAQGRQFCSARDDRNQLNQSSSDLAFEQQNASGDDNGRESRQNREIGVDAGEAGIFQEQVLERIDDIGERVDK